jgi:protein TonB
MFEQTLLTHPASARKTGALAASFVAQMTILGVLFVGPLLYTQVLPLMVLAPEPLFAPTRRVTPPPDVPTTANPRNPSSGPSYRTFNAPATVPKGPIRNDVVVGAELIPNENVVGPVIPELTGGRPGVNVLPEVAIPVEVAKTKPVPVAEAVPTRVSGGAQAAKLITRVVPAYPPLALRMRVSGTVHLLGIIGKDGRIRDLQVLDGHPMLRQAALEAVRQWIYSPTVLSGQPVEVEAPIDVNFTLR